MTEYIGAYELFALPCARESTETVGYSVFRNPLGTNGHRSHVLYGADTGLRRWTTAYDPLPGNEHAGTITIDGVLMNRAKYIRDLFQRTQVSGRPFVIQSDENSQFYLCEFSETEQTLTKKLTALYSTQVNLVQVRLTPEVSVFDVSKVSGLWGWFKGEHINLMGGVWPGEIAGGPTLTVTGDIEQTTDSGSGLYIARFNSSTDYVPPPGGFANTTADPTIYEAFFIMSVRAAAFSSYQGVLTADATIAALVGDTGQTKFVDLSFGSTYTYRRTGLQYLESNQQAPVDGAFGLVHVRWQNGVPLANLQIGKDRAYTDRYAKIDIGEVVLFSTLQPLSQSRELAAHLQTRWAI